MWRIDICPKYPILNRTNNNNNFSISISIAIELSYAAAPVSVVIVNLNLKPMLRVAIAKKLCIRCEQKLSISLFLLLEPQLTINYSNRITSNAIYRIREAAIDPE